jgi:putative tryptophan/tyrosine transport system substrate-binding protein
VKIWAIIALGLSLLVPAQAGAQQMVPITDWFRVSSDAGQFWMIREVAPDHIRIEPKNATPMKRKAVGVVYPRLSSAYDIAISTILETFQQSDQNVEIDVRNFRNNNELAAKVLTATVAAKPDLILAMGSEAVDYIFDNYKSGTIPVVTVCAKDPVSLGQMANYEYGSSTNFAFTSLNMPVEVQMAYLLDLKPSLRNISILVDSKNISAIETQERPIAMAARRRGLTVIDGTVSDPLKAAAELESLIPQITREMKRTDPELKNSVFIVSGSTAVFREIATVARLAGNVTVLSLIPEVVQPGLDSAALSIGISFESNARLAASYAMQVLENPARVGQLRVGIVSPPDISINFAVTRAIGLRVPFSLLEAASFVYDNDGVLVRSRGQIVRKRGVITPS